MTEPLERVYQVRYTDPKVSPGSWRYSDGMLIGYFSTEQKAREALDRVSGLPGFREDPSGFVITTFSIGETLFREGFQASADETVIDAWLHS